MSSESQLPDDPRLNRIIEEYLRRQDSGQPIDLDSICRSYPDLADQLRAFLSDEDAVRAASGSGEMDDRPTTDRETIAPQRSSPAARLVGETIAGRYRLTQVLGSGAMGCVYLAEDLSQKSQVAIKTPFFEGPHEKERKRRFRREAAALAAIRHPNICRVFEHGEHRGTPYLVMEYIEGPTLADLVSVQGIDPRQAALLCRGIAEGLGAAHAAGVVHRDLKPRNVLIETATRRVVVTDFGLARFTDDTETKLTHDGVVLGTPAYMPPEQVDGTWDQVGPRSDLYSLGIVLYELLTGKPPFTGRMYAVLGQVMHDKIPPVRKVRGDLDPEIDHICQTLTAKKPAERYPSARAVSAALMDYLANTDPAAKAEKRQATQLAAEREARRERVMVLCRKGKYAEAAAVLKEIGQWTGPGTDEYVRWARQEMEKLRSLPQKLRQDQSVLAETAQQLLSRHDYASVVQLLQDVPPDYRSDAVQKLLDKAVDRQDEVDLLQVAIQDAIERRQFGGLEKTLRRLLVLKPGYTPAQKMLAALQEYQRRGIRDYKFSKSGELLPPEGLGLLSGAKLAALVGVLALLVTYWLVKVYLAGSPQGELAVAVPLPEPPKPDDMPIVEAALTPLPEDGPVGQFHVLRGHTQPVYALRFSPDGKYLISTSGDSTLKVWDLATLTQKYSKRLEKGVGREWGISDNGRLAIANWEATFVFDIETGTELTRIPVPGLTAAISRDGTRVAITERTVPVTVWQIASDATVTKLCEFPRGPGEWTSLNFVRDDSQVVCSSSDGHLIRFDAVTGQELGSNRGVDPSVHRTNKGDFLLLTRDEKRYLCLDFGRKSLHDLETSDLQQELPDTHRMQFVPGDRYVAYLNHPSSIQIYDLDQKTLSENLPARDIRADRKDADYLAISPDGRYLATGGGNYWDGQKFIDTGDNSIYLWRIPKEYWPEVTPPGVAPASREPLAAQSTPATPPGQASVDLKPIDRWTIQAGETKWFDVEVTTSNFDEPMELTLSPVVPGLRVEVAPTLSSKSTRGRLCLVAAPNAEGKSTVLTLQAASKSAVDSITIPLTIEVKRNERIYVDRSAKPGGDGKSWASALNDLQAAMALSRKPDSRVREIWVAKGIYKPVGRGGSRESTFLLINGVSLYGSFAGTESALDQRRMDQNESILSGDLNGDDASGFKKRGDNSYHVIQAEKCNSDTRLDGFVVTAGYADGPAHSNPAQSNRIGGGILMVDCECAIHNCTFQDNSAADWGGAGFLEKFEGRVSNCTFLANRAVVGGAVCAHGPADKPSRPAMAFVRCRFQGNRANAQAGAIKSLNNPLKLINCEFIANHVEGGAGGPPFGGGALFNEGASLNAMNCFFSKNDCIGDGGAVNINKAGAKIVHCTFADNECQSRKGVDLTAWGDSVVSIQNCILSSKAGDPLSKLSQYGRSAGGVYIADSCVRGSKDKLDTSPLLIDQSYKLDGRSPCIDAGAAITLDIDEYDLDADGDTSEPIPIDLEGNPRIQGLPDLGAFESRVQKAKE